MPKTNTRALHHLLDVSASRFPDNVAVEESETGSIRYTELAHLSDRLRDRLRVMGVGPGDRVGICMRKSADAIASVFGIMKTGAAYVPADSTAPVSRNAYIFDNCAVKVVIVEERLVKALNSEFSQLGFAPQMVVIDGIGAGALLVKALDQLDAVNPVPSAPSAAADPSRLAYILYTSGSTGRKVLCCRTVMLPALSTGAPTYFNRTNMIGFPLMRRFISICRSSTFTYRLNTAQR